MQAPTSAAVTAQGMRSRCEGEEAETCYVLNFGHQLDLPDVTGVNRLTRLKGLMDAGHHQHAEGVIDTAGRVDSCFPEGSEEDMSHDLRAAMWGKHLGGMKGARRNQQWVDTKMLAWGRRDWRPLRQGSRGRAAQSQAVPPAVMTMEQGATSRRGASPRKKWARPWLEEDASGHHQRRLSAWRLTDACPGAERMLPLSPKQLRRREAAPMRRT